MDPAEIARFTAINRRAWDAIAPVRGAGLHSGERFAQGVPNLATDELPIPDWNGLTVLHLQCASGEDTLSLALAGARVTGVDIAAENIKHARRKAEIAGLSATFLVADVYDLPADLLSARFRCRLRQLWCSWVAPRHQSVGGDRRVGPEDGRTVAR